MALQTFSVVVLEEQGENIEVPIVQKKSSASLSSSKSVGLKFHIPFSLYLQKKENSHDYHCH